MTDRVAATGLLVEPLPDMAAWSAFFGDAEIPVTREAAETLEWLRCREDTVDANRIGDMFANDPFITLKILARNAKHRGSRVLRPPETVTAAIVMMGVSPFFRAFERQPVVEDRMPESTPALAGLERALLTARASGDLALAFATHRSDPHAAAIHGAALLRHFSELLLWCHAPQLALRVAAAQVNRPDLPADVAEQEVLNIHLCTLQQCLMKAWSLPSLFSEAAMDPAPRRLTAARTASLAARIARHCADDRQSDRMSHDLEDASELLNLSIDSTVLFVQRILGKGDPCRREGG